MRLALVEAVIGLALAAAVWMLYGPVLRLWWTHDDFFFLRSLLDHRPFWYFVDASVYRELLVLAPLLFFSFDLDRRLFGLEPSLFYVHHLAALSVCAALLYGVARLWLARLWAVVAVWIFLIGPVTASLACILMVRHYIETIVLAALSVAAWAGALRRFPGSWRLAWLSAALYFAACMAKELAVPLFVLLPLLPAPGPRPVDVWGRMRLALPHAFALTLYLALRYALLGALFTSYGFAVRPLDLPALAVGLPAKLATEFVGGRASVAALVFAFALAAGISTFLVLPHGRRRCALVGGALLLAMLPFLPVSTRIEPRYAVPAWIVIAIAFAIGCGTLAETGRRTAAVVIAIVACASGLWLNREDWRPRFARIERMSVENRFVLEMTEADVLRQPLTLAASLEELAWMKEAVYQRPRGGRWFQDDLFLCLHPDPLGRVWGYDAGARRVVDLTGRIPEVRDRYCSAIRSDAALTVSFQVAGHDLFWDLGPHRTGKYRFVLGDGRMVFEVPGSAGFQMRGRQALPALRIGYESPEGWVTYSPELTLQFVDGWTLRWSRP